MIKEYKKYKKLFRIKNRLNVFCALFVVFCVEFLFEMITKLIGINLTILLNKFVMSFFKNCVELLKVVIAFSNQQKKILI